MAAAMYAFEELCGCSFSIFFFEHSSVRDDGSCSIQHCAKYGSCIDCGGSFHRTQRRPRRLCMENIVMCMLRCGSLEPLVVKVFSCESLWLSLVVKVSTADICLVSAHQAFVLCNTADICHVSTQQTSFLSQLPKTTTMQSSIYSRAQVVIIFESPQSLKCFSC